MPSPSVVVLITGANSGIGYATAKVIASASAHYHVILASRSPEKGNAASEAIKAAGIKGEISTLELDVTDQSSIAAAAAQIEADHGHLDVLINNAGIYIKEGTLKDQLEKTFSTNVIGPALMTEAFTPLLLKSSRPYLLHISSKLGSIALASDPRRFDYGLDALGYRVSKAALNMLMQQGAKSLGQQGVKVFAVCPGLVESNIRGKSQEERSVGGKAGDPEVSGQTVLRIIEGGRDADVGRFVDKDGVLPW